MIYIVGGASRSGKSTLAERMRVRHGVPWFPLDALRAGLHAGAPSMGISYDEDLKTADIMWPTTSAVLTFFLTDGRDYLVEGVNMRPEAVATFAAQCGDRVKACFLGYPDISIERKMANVIAYAGQPNDWLSHTGPDNIRLHVTSGRAASRALRDECEAIGLPFVDTGADFDLGMETAEAVLKGARGR